MPTGRGNTLGEALGAALGLREGGPYTSYTAVGWHAQISKLTSSTRGYAAASAAGLDVAAQTLRRWLSEEQTPSPANIAKIREAYGNMAGRFPDHLARKEIEIHGEVAFGRDVRDRGSGGHAPLRIEGRDGDWSEIEEKWNDGELDEDELEDLFGADVVNRSLGGSPPRFTGGSYTVSV